MSAVELEDVNFRYSAKSSDVLSIGQLRIERGETVFIYGPSGSGKSTLLGLIGGLLLPDRGAVRVLDQTVSSMSHSSRDRFRAAEMGFIFQVFNLVPYLSVMDNVTLPCRFGRGVSSGYSSSTAEARELLSRLGIADKCGTNVQQLSIGQQQRVAAARALMGSPGLIIADEPTSALDSDARVDFLSVLFEQSRREKSTILFVSHDRSLASLFNRAVGLSDINRVHAAGVSP
jgi:putative ABC transport system ATP-binding protein